MLTIFYYDKFQRKIDFKVHPRDYKFFVYQLLESSLTEDLGPIYIEKEDGSIAELDYYNED